MKEKYIYMFECALKYLFTVSYFEDIPISNRFFSFSKHFGQIANFKSFLNSRLHSKQI